MTDTSKRKNSRLDDLTFYALNAIVRSRILLLSDIERYLMPLKISHGRLTILLSIIKAGNGIISPAEIARRSGQSIPTITKMIVHLESDGLIRTETDPIDRQQKPLRITKQGTALLDRIIPENNLRLFQMSRKLVENDKRQLLKILSKMDFFDPEKTIGKIQ